MVKKKKKKIRKHPSVHVIMLPGNHPIIRAKRGAILGRERTWAVRQAGRARRVAPLWFRGNVLLTNTSLIRWESLTGPRCFMSFLCT